MPGFHREDAVELTRSFASQLPAVRGLLISDLRAAFVGLSLRHDRSTLARAALEGVALTIRAQLMLLAQGGAPATELRISGGDTRLATWNQIKADVTGLPVTTVPGDAAVTGVAMLTGLGVAIYGSTDDAIRRCVRPDPPLEPNPALSGPYAEAFARFQELVASPALRHAL